MQRQPATRLGIMHGRCMASMGRVAERFDLTTVVRLKSVGSSGVTTVYLEDKVKYLGGAPHPAFGTAFWYLGNIPTHLRQTVLPLSLIQPTEANRTDPLISLAIPKARNPAYRDIAPAELLSGKVEPRSWLSQFLAMRCGSMITSIIIVLMRKSSVTSCLANGDKVTNIMSGHVASM